MSQFAKPEERQYALSQAIQAEVVRGCRVESQGPDTAVLVTGKRPNHVLHAILSVVTLGFWLPVWLIVALVVRERRVMLTVDQFATVNRQEIKRA